MLLSPSPEALPLLRQVQALVRDEILPHEARWLREQRAQADPFTVLPELRALKASIAARGLSNLFLRSVGGSVVDYAHLAEVMGHSSLAPDLFNCNAPDTGNMELLELAATPEQRERWLEPLLRGEIRSAFCMTEPEVASSDASNLQASLEIRPDRLVLNGRKWWSTGALHPDCRLLVFVGRSDPDAPRHARHSLALVPRDTPGVQVVRPLTVFGDADPPYGHAEIVFDGVELPRSALLGQPGQGFSLAQARLGPGRIHHCMRLLGAAERGLALLCQRAAGRVAFGRPLADLGANRTLIAQARIDLEMARLLTLKAAYAIDKGGAKSAQIEIAAIKAVVPALACRILDQAIQVHGGAGLSEDTPLAALYGQARLLRLADGPDEVHLATVARLELARASGSGAP